MASVKVKQDDLRRLMKERRESAKIKIDSPFAKYNKLGQLSCTICNVVVKSNNLWGPHVAGKIHKENLSKPKKIAAGDLKSAIVIDGKRNLEQSNDVKRFKSSRNDYMMTGSSESSKPTTLLASYESSDESNEGDMEVESTTPSKSSTNKQLPSDFFESTAQPASVPTFAEVKSEQENAEVPSAIKKNGETLPEGFFDDPVLDAKARNIEYKDPVEEEWERFQKTIAEETNVSKVIIEEDLEESTLERDIDQIDEQIQQWERVKNLQSLAEDVIVKAPKKNDKDGESGGSDDELEEDDLLDWRSKGVKKL